MRTRTLIALTVLGSVLASAAIVAGVRLVQHLTSSDYVQTPVRVDLPGARARPVAAVLGLHASMLSGGRTNVSARKHATGLMAVMSTDGSVVGEAMVPKDPLLKDTPVRVSYESTAVSLVQQTPALITSSPLLSALIESEAHRSPAVARLAGVLSSEAAARSDYLTHPDAELRSSLTTAERDVVVRVRGVFGGSASRSASAPTTATDVALRPPQARLTNPPGQVFSAPLPDQIVLPDISGQTACSTHSVTTALCLDNTYPLWKQYPELNGTDWSAGWQMLYLSSQLTPGQGGTQLPFALLPPVVNAPPTLVGVFSTIADFGIRTTSDVEALCLAVKSELVQNSICGLPSTAKQLADALLSQLTLGGTSNAVHVPLAQCPDVHGQLACSQRLELDPLSAVGAGISPGSRASLTELNSWKASMVMSLASELVIPAIQLVLDARSLHDDFTAHANEKLHDSAHEEAQHTESQITKLEQKVSQLSKERDTSRVNVDHLEGDVKTARTSLDSAQTAVESAHADVDSARASAEAAQAKVSNQEKKLQAAQPASRGGLTAALNRYRREQATAQSHLDQAHSALTSAEQHLATAEDTLSAAERRLGVARAIEDTNPKRTEEAERQLAGAREKLRGLERKAEEADRHGKIATTDSLMASIFAEYLAVANTDGRYLDCAYNALTAGDDGKAAHCLGPVEDQLQRDAGFLVPLAVQSGLQFGVGLTVSTALYEFCLPCHVIDFASNALGFIQDAVDLGETLTIPDRHDFPAIDTNYRRGSTLAELPKLFLGAIPAEALARGVAGVASNALLSRITGQRGPFVTSITTVCPDTVIVPDAYINGRLVGILNVSNILQAHLAGGFGAIKETSSLGGAVPFAVVQSLTPLGAGGASFADPAAEGAPVHVTDEGAGLDYRSFDGRVSKQIPDSGDPLVEYITPSRGTKLSDSRGVGGFVFSTTGRDAGQLVGLAEDENNGQLVMLTGPGVADITASVPICANPLDESSGAGFF
jgi:hypothetical protein